VKLGPHRPKHRLYNLPFGLANMKAAQGVNTRLNYLRRNFNRRTIMLGKMGTPLNGFAAIAFIEVLTRLLVTKGVISKDELGAVFDEVANMLGQQPAANSQHAVIAVTRAKPV
jgi:hypothetical protein